MAEDSGIVWHVDSHEHQERSTDWYWGLGLGALAAAGIAIFLGNALLAVIVALGAGSLGVLVARGPREHQVSVGPRGVSIDGTLYRYQSIDSFWVEEHANPHLLVTTQGILHPQFILPLYDRTRAASVRSYLKRYIQEEEQHPHFGHQVAQLLGL